jgi:purine-cytosine permease-like protein
MKTENWPDKLLNISMVLVIIAFVVGAIGIVMSFITSDFSGIMFAIIGGGLFNLALVIAVVALIMRFIQKPKTK